MTSFGKKILSAFVEVTEEKETVADTEQTHSVTAAASPAKTIPAGSIEKFRQYFEQLFSDANLPGPDYFEFARMTQVMMAIPDEKARYSAAYAGLSVQGLDKNKLLDTAAAYLKILETDAANFNATADAAIAEKVQAKQQDIQNKQQRIEQLSREMTDLQNQNQLLQTEVKENEEKIDNNTGGYKAASANMRQQIQNDIEKIKQHLS
jgi:hypothetical protein